MSGHRNGSQACYAQMSATVFGPVDNNDPDLYQTVSRLGERVSTLEQRVGEAYSVVNQTSVIIGTVNGRLDSLDQSMTRLATTVIHELSEQNRRLDRFETRLTGVENRLANVENHIVGVENHLGNIEARMTGFEVNLNEFRRELEDKIDRANNRTVSYMALMFGAVGVIVGLITYS